ncbi:hypothetical protein RV11_GL001540 [Enterococcus phoeniculicola]|jgi:hypothetical protein|uniref:Uncharacterized protein n=1 Tax=Enterococcus phoeniculicola ATCC BAA-412 TaxID=1158610 RepID=R3W348_9ENTE|nr:hypothetical protein [Enterococcus phoeniculicola]EOL41876.1 hypothetical protein UC3_02224 [Enterococcus phoeniculicola ATCC BAA-412]EOT79845.1 hypothetical protein I589_01357 [Enterococcus phoeniculicola ATCC BAA-412]OJG70267.1 hypothetical protein RV11_GL001540 [Enterococcus phoeniculicola]
MTFTQTNIEYRIAFDTVQNKFMAIDAHDEANFAYGITIEDAIKELKKNI